MRISDRAFDFIVAQEVTSRDWYEKRLRRPTWPGASSGATVGIGYDLGMTKAETITEDWKGRVPDSVLSAMVSASGRVGAGEGRSATEAISPLVDVPWETALAVHRECVVPRWETTVRNALPNTDALHPHSFGALVSLTFNRGPSFSRDGDRFREMRAIKAHMAARAFDKIPAELRAMKRLWAGQGLAGLLARRDAEAALFEAGLATQTGTTSPAAPPHVTTDTRAARIVAAMERRGCVVDRGADQANIVYVEGVDIDLKPNANRANGFDDARFVVVFRDGVPDIAGAWEATTEPGKQYTERPLSKLGAARIAHGQQRCWQVGTHHAGKASAHEALVQTGGAVTVFRDGDRDYRRDGDKTETGWFGINQHHGYDYPRNDIKGASAGCLVGRTTAGHRAFMALVKRDPRYIADPKFVFRTTVLPAADVVGSAASSSDAAPKAGPAAAAGGAVAAPVVAAASGAPTWVIVTLAVVALAVAIGIGIAVIRKRKEN